MRFNKHAVYMTTLTGRCFCNWKNVWRNDLITSSFKSYILNHPVKMYSVNHISLIDLTCSCNSYTKCDEVSIKHTSKVLVHILVTEEPVLTKVYRYTFVQCTCGTLCMYVYKNYNYIVLKCVLIGRFAINLKHS